MLRAKKKPVPQIELTVTFGVLNIYLQDFTCLLLYQFQVVCKSSAKSMEYFQITITSIEGSRTGFGDLTNSARSLNVN